MQSRQELFPRFNLAMTRGRTDLRKLSDSLGDHCKMGVGPSFPGTIFGPSLSASDRIIITIFRGTGSGVAFN
jgi:hypothetical protein